MGEKVYTGEKKERLTLIWGEKRLKIGAKGSSIVRADCDKIKEQKQWELLGLLTLPVTWEKETYLPYETRAYTRSREEAEQLGRDALEEYLAGLLEEDGSVTSRRFASAVQGDALLVTLSAECEEQIGREVPVAVNEG